MRIMKNNYKNRNNIKNNAVKKGSDRIKLSRKLISNICPEIGLSLGSWKRENHIEIQLNWEYSKQFNERMHVIN